MNLLLSLFNKYEFEVLVLGHGSKNGDKVVEEPSCQFKSGQRLILSFSRAKKK